MKLIFASFVASTLAIVEDWVAIAPEYGWPCVIEIDRTIFDIIND